MTSNIDILYTVGKYFSPQLRIWDRYIKIRLYLTRINWQCFAILHKKSHRWSEQFRLEQRVPLQQGGREELIGTHFGHQNWPKDGGGHWEAMPCHFAILWRPSYGICGELKIGTRQSWRGCVLHLERDTSWTRREKERLGGRGRIGGEKGEASFTWAIAGGHCELQRGRWLLGGKTWREERERERERDGKLLGGHLAATCWPF